METKTLKTTPLNSWHRNNGANMADFGGFDMPLWYESGVKNEHIGVIESAGIFDTSHMACVMVAGKDALSLLQLCHTRDLANLKDGRCVYGVILNEKGHVIDDAIVYRFTSRHYMVCVNAGMGKDVALHLHANKKTLDATVDDLSEKLAKMDIQGKNSAKILSLIIENPDSVFEKMPYFSFKGFFNNKPPFSSDDTSYSSVVNLKNGTPVLLSRSGYTGEFGFELFVEPDKIVDLWETILKAGAKYNLIPCGLGARDSLRAGAVLPLSHQDVGSWKFINNPWMFALPLKPDNPVGENCTVVKEKATLVQENFTKDFIGRDALLSKEDLTFTLPFAGETLRKVSAGKDTRVIDANGNDIGHVLTCATDMAIGWHNDKIYSIASSDKPEGFKAKGISCGFIMVDRKIEAGEKVTLQEKKRKIMVTVMSDIRPDRTARNKISTFLP
ncbi:GcvT [Desulfamplus magnetovallimortis]|uniref:GcvT n=1 Tax=Desulfamplus magnetovallimortis TaxID=1246637 RepID=A0A1W1HAK5_9BACT|nr:aminomethyltransferase family protein [Desulfamplus magnetovallimortis]SLM29452.1 GcvT [Desulfamplus magnetovallimortis]